ncbi:CTTNBP2 N-terminal-like protein [Pimephales promelas]|nr:CTTNBP2 N-terminal-like protein [Pimephales promelas]
MFQNGLEFERGQVQRLERERSVLSNQAEEDLAQQQQLSSTLAKECQKATARAEEESQRVADLSRQLEQESSAIEIVKRELESEHARAQQIEARAEKKLAEFDTEHKQMRGKLLKEEKRYQELLEQFNSLKKELDEIKEREKARMKRIMKKRPVSTNDSKQHATSFQQQAEVDQQLGGTVVHSPRDLSPTAATPPPTPDNSTAKQMARNTVTQVLSRFTSQQVANKLPPSNSSPFGTDYRNLAAVSSPTGKSPGILSPGIRSPIIPRAEKFHPPPVPPKKQGVNQSPNSPVPSGKASHFPELTGSCGLTSSQEDATELDLVVSSSS